MRTNPRALLCPCPVSDSYHLADLAERSRYVHMLKAWQLMRDVLKERGFRFLETGVQRAAWCLMLAAPLAWLCLMSKPHYEGISCAPRLQMIYVPCCWAVLASTLSLPCTQLPTMHSGCWCRLPVCDASMPVVQLAG
jgi:hypothetical protein